MMKACVFALLASSAFASLCQDDLTISTGKLALGASALNDALKSCQGGQSNCVSDVETAQESIKKAHDEIVKTQNVCANITTSCTTYCSGAAAKTEGASLTLTQAASACKATVKTVCLSMLTAVTLDVADAVYDLSAATWTCIPMVGGEAACAADIARGLGVIHHIQKDLALASEICSRNATSKQCTYYVDDAVAELTPLGNMMEQATQDCSGLNAQCTADINEAAKAMQDGRFDLQFYAAIACNMGEIPECIAAIGLGVTELTISAAKLTDAEKDCKEN